jgi:tRNA A-37 threonylcarbamoyl transferase component Bud32
MPVSDPPGPLLGAGRAADVYDIGAGRVLRRYRVPFDVQPEAAIMQHLHRAGFPVPAVYDADGRDLVMERLDGRDMLVDLGRRPWLARRHARTLAEMHNRLHQV